MAGQPRQPVVRQQQQQPQNTEPFTQLSGTSQTTSITTTDTYFTFPSTMLMEKPLFPQALTTTFHSRVENENTALYITTQTSRGKKRNATVVNYAEDFFEENSDDDNSDDSLTSSSRRRNGSSMFSMSSVDPNNLTGNALLNNFQGKLATKTPHQRFTNYEMVRNANAGETLVPIRIDLDHNNGNNRIVDFFMWNLHETLLTPEKFAEIMCQDLEFSAGVQQQIANSIQLQLDDYSQSMPIQLAEDLHIHVVIDLTVNLEKQFYDDKFEWDLTCSEGLTPEQFAEIVVADLGISREFYPAIAHALHEAIINSKKDALEGRLPQEVVNGAAYGREAGWRFDPENLGQEWCPTVETLTQQEIEKREMEKQRNMRRMKRDTKKVDDGRRGRRSRRYDELEGTWVTY
ncbi:Sfh1 protein [Saccharomycopsis crataegensis]|uniref:Sfh1 protein n=1 Tax=Saccharomycopsis crataegensis TaxID=43959 RepID=A0AAV5QTL8_9ASCO|nr:Sfh1 protein [Saccharomycopsis crataegensis]